jgi:hypothetical protein
MSAVDDGAPRIHVKCSLGIYWGPLGDKVVRTVSPTQIFRRALGPAAYDLILDAEFEAIDVAFLTAFKSEMMSWINSTPDFDDGVVSVTFARKTAWSAPNECHIEWTGCTPREIDVPLAGIIERAVAALNIPAIRRSSYNTKIAAYHRSRDPAAARLRFLPGHSAEALLTKP